MPPQQRIPLALYRGGLPAAHGQATGSLDARSVRCQVGEMFIQGHGAVAFISLMSVRRTISGGQGLAALSRIFFFCACHSSRAPYHRACPLAPDPHAPSLWAPRSNSETNLVLVVWDIPPVPSSRRAVANGQSTPAIYEVALNHGLGGLGMFYFFYLIFKK
jgi:hypothetical protein